MPPNKDLYQGREHSWIKHLILERYLQEAAYKLFQGRSPVFNFIDAFAGPWGNSDGDNLTDTSFSRAIVALENVRRILTNLGHPGLKVRFRFCELVADSARKLQQYASEKQEFDIKIFRGAFEDNLDKIHSSCIDVPDSFNFTFIDPTGWDVDSSPVFSFLRKLNGEVLFNFMSEHINRHAEFDGVASSFGRFVANPDWRSDFEQLPSGTNEEKILSLFKAKMRESGAASYLPDFAIMKPREERIKMRLILGTHSAHGVEVFRTVQQKVEKEETETRENILATKTGQPLLFPERQIAEFKAKTAGVGCPANQVKAKKLLLNLVTSQPRITYGRAAPLVMEAISIRTTHLNTVVMSMRKEGLLLFDLPERKRTPLPTTILRPSAT